MRRLAALAMVVLSMTTFETQASLECDGVWDAGVWDTSVWDDGVWDEDACSSGNPGKRGKGVSIRGLGVGL